MKDWTFEADKLKSVPFEGYKFWHPPELANWGQALADGTYELAMMNCLREMLGSEMVFFDVGAHIGTYVLLAASRAKRVFAFEPTPRNLAVLEQNVERNGLDNVVVVAKPLFSTVTSGLLNSKDRFQPGEGQVRSLTLDSIDIVPDVIKIDAEGAEADILLGGAKILPAHKPTLLLELHPRLLSRYRRTPEEVKKTLRRYGYRTLICLGEKKDSDISWWKIEA